MKSACLLIFVVALAACESQPEPRTPTSTGEPAPTASTSAEPLWISNQKPPSGVAR